MLIRVGGRVFRVAEPHEARRPTLFGVEEGIGAALVDLVTGSTAVAARRADLLLRGGTRVSRVAEPRGTPRFPLFSLEWGMEVGMKVRSC